LNWDQIKYLADAFKEIAEEYGIEIYSGTAGA
jgi:hypothetical protein